MASTGSSPFITTLRHGGIYRAGVAALLVFVLLLRGLIPAGYMPDMNALKDGVFKITVCSASGFETVLVDSDNQPVDAKAATGDAAPEHDDKKSANLCPFGWVPHVALLALILHLFSTLHFPQKRRFMLRECFTVKACLCLAQPRGPPATI